MPALGQVGAGEGGGEQDLQLDRAVRGVHQQVTAAGFERMARLQLPYLRELHIIDAAITDQGLVAIESMTGLRWLNIDKVKIGNVSLVCNRNLENLAGLHLTSTRVTDTGLWKLARMKQLERENRDLRRTNAILQDASIFFATALDGQTKR